MPTTIVPTTPAGVQLATYETDHHAPHPHRRAHRRRPPPLRRPRHRQQRHPLPRRKRPGHQRRAPSAHRRLPDQGRTPRLPPNARVDLTAPTDRTLSPAMTPHSACSLAALAVGVVSRASIRELPTDLDIRGSRDHGWQSGRLVGGRWGVLIGRRFVFDLITGSHRTHVGPSPPSGIRPTHAVLKRGRRSPPSPLRDRAPGPRSPDRHCSASISRRRDHFALRPPRGHAHPCPSCRGSAGLTVAKGQARSLPPPRGCAASCAGDLALNPAIRIKASWSSGPPRRHHIPGKVDQTQAGVATICPLHEHRAKALDDES
jgi:hypothetical protein